jgi:hypothetical protein
MTKVRVAGFALSLDGFGAGPEQSIDDPLGKRGGATDAGQGASDQHYWVAHL